MRVKVCLLMATLLVACTSKDFYVVGQEWQVEQCRKLQDPAERSRCEKSTARSYEAYKAEADKARTAPSR